MTLVIILAYASMMKIRLHHRQRLSTANLNAEVNAVLKNSPLTYTMFLQTGFPYADIPGYEWARFRELKRSHKEGMEYGVQ